MRGGTAGNDFLVGGLGDDILNGGGDIDALVGGAGNDVFIYDRPDRRVDGGTGVDTLQLANLNQNLDLTQANLAGGFLTDLEILDLIGFGNNAVSFDKLDLLNLSSTSNALRILGDVGDSVISAGQGWALDGGGPLDIGGVLFNGYTAGAARLLVDTDISATLS